MVIIILVINLVFFTGNDVIFLDPHTTQQIGMLPNKDIETELKIDQSYHCQQINRLPILTIDPSLAAVSVHQNTFCTILY